MYLSLFLIPQLIQGVGFALVFVALSTAAPANIPPRPRKYISPRSEGLFIRPQSETPRRDG